MLTVGNWRSLVTAGLLIASKAASFLHVTVMLTAYDGLLASRSGKTSILGMLISKNAFLKLQAMGLVQMLNLLIAVLRQHLQGIRYKSGALYRLESMFLQKLQCRCSGELSESES